MSYQAVPSSEQADNKDQPIKHRNPVYPALRYPTPKGSTTLESQITSSLLFQQLIYFNWFYSFVEFYLYASSQLLRFIYFKTEYGVPVRTIVGIGFLFLQIFRLQNAFYGNIKESFPQIFAFIMITVLTIAAQLMLLAGLAPTSPMEWAVLFVGLVLHCVELLIVVFTMGRLTQSQKALFLWRTPLKQNNNTKQT